MGTLVFQANLGGAVNLVGPNTASTVNFTLPSADGSSGQALVTNGSGTLSFSSFVSAAAGSNTQVQFNSSGAFAGSANLTFNGTTLTAANTSVTTSETLSYGTANGVAYLNGSKVVTTGSALTFDGTNLTTSNVKATGLVYAGVSASSAGQFRVFNASNDKFLQIFNDGTVSVLNSTYGSSGASPLAFQISDSEQMRLTSTGLGIGTSSPATKLQVAGEIRSSSDISNSSNAVIYSYAGGSAGSVRSGIQMVGTSQELRFYTAGSQNATLDSSGNLGLGVTPSAWGSGKQAFENQGFALWSGSTGNFLLANNVYQNSGGTYIYKNTAASTMYYQNAGAHTWYTAPSGTAGNAISFTQAMTLTAAGFLGVGTTNPPYGLTVSDANGVGLEVGPGSQYSAGKLLLQAYNRSGGAYAQMDFAASLFTWLVSGTERARIDSSGNLLVGTTATINAAKSVISFTSSNNGLYLQDSTGVSGAQFMRFDSSASTCGSITRVAATSAVTYNTTSDYRLKNVIGVVSESGSRIDALEPIEYEWKSDGTRTRGFLAHKFQEVYPHSVTGEKDALDAENNPIYQSMQAGSAEVIADLVAEIQSLRARVAQLESN